MSVLHKHVHISIYMFSSIDLALKGNPMYVRGVSVCVSMANRLSRDDEEMMKR